MGFSTSAVVIIFAASMIYIASIFYPLTNMSYHRVLEAKKKFDDIQYDKLNTKISIINTQIDGSKLTIIVYNNGSLTLNASKLNVIYNGSIKSYTVSNPGVWPPKNSINVTLSNGAANSRIKIITANGAADYIVT